MGMFFLFFNNTNIKFKKKKLTWKKYIAINTLPTTHWVKLINKKKFAKIVLNKNSKIFMLYIAALKAIKIVNMQSTFLKSLKLIRLITYYSR